MGPERPASAGDKKGTGRFCALIAPYVRPMSAGKERPKAFQTALLGISWCSI